MELNDFYNAGFGWICRHCERELAGGDEEKKRARVWREGEAESKNPALSSPALAKWADPARRMLLCPRCGIRESVDKF
jgi:hypothetical protein